LRTRGVAVSLFAGPGTDPMLRAEELPVRRTELSPAARNDVSMPPEEWMEQHQAYLRLMVELSRRRDVDLVHNNSLHYLPVAMAELLDVPVLTTLHTPPTPWLEPAVAQGDPASNHYAAVSRCTARQWSHVAAASTVRNGVDLAGWPEGPGGDELVWFGRMVPEKGAHHAVEIARRAGRRLRLAGPLSDPDYWSREVKPRLGRHAEYVGHLRQAELAALVGASGAGLVTPQWEEPYGLVVAEALACGTPVVGYARGGVPEVAGPGCSRLVAPDDVEAAAAAVDEATPADTALSRG
jgi:glycosyltransferase involved in cell wall biosynthesis